MGNAALTIHHPTSLRIEPPYLESGKVIKQTPGMIRCEKKAGAAVGCGGVFTLKKNVKGSEYTFEIRQTTGLNANLRVGARVTIRAPGYVEERV